MAKFCIRLGRFNKILLIPFLLTLVQIAITIYKLYFPKESGSFLIGGVGESLGQMAIIIIPYIKCFSVSRQKEKEKCQCQCSKINFLHYFILLLIYLIDTAICLFLAVFMNSAFSEISDIFTTKEAISIIFITILLRLLLKYEYFIHHYLSTFIFVVFCISIDVLLYNYSSFSDAVPLDIILNFLTILTNVGYLCFIKYMIDKHYHYYWNIVFSLGTMKIIIIFILFFLSYQSLLDSLKTIPLGISIATFFLEFILYFIYYLLEILSIFYLSPEYILIAQIAAKIVNILEKGNDNKYFCIIFFILQYFSLMIYLEILELNFCNLNKNTKRNIKLRIDVDDGQIERIESLDDSKFEAGDGYIFENEEEGENEKNNLQIELN